ncbi:MAG: 2,3-bisphosphoglycerate-independent phosphoglycerate mutase [Bacteroidales bacterium]|nr:2,3-bisphosphoglycerate-independent phosphoglycerate mutase [Bacteroidales bacterium]
MKKTILVILDGWGIGNKSKSDAIFNAETPYIDSLMLDYPNSQLLTSGENVGLPDGVMGNSEVGHMNIGAGRVIYQDLVKINKDVRTGEIAKNEAFVNAFEYAKKNNKAVHFLGLLSDGGVHSMDTHLYKLCDLTKEHGLEKVFIHALTDGRDTDPKSGIGYMKSLLKHLETSNGKIATITGRYYTMDRDKRWDRVKIGYDAMVSGIGEKTTDLIDAMQKSYNEGVTDEFIKPIINVDENNEPIGNIKEGDVVIAYNYRTDRLRQITIAFTQEEMPEHGMKIIPLHYVTMTRYDDKFQGLHIAYDKPNIKNTLGETVSSLGLNQLRIAETEKYAHVTFFFSGGQEKPFENEDRLLVNSPKVATYDLQPEMSAIAVKEKVVNALNSQKYHLVVLNFANGDMVGHTGIYEAILKAANVIDGCVKDVVETAKKNDYASLIIADHGNADFVMNEDGSPNTQHSLNPVPCIFVDDMRKDVKLNNGILADVAPTLCKIIGIEKPQDMTGKELF